MQINPASDWLISAALFCYWATKLRKPVNLYLPKYFPNVVSFTMTTSFQGNRKIYALETMQFWDYPLTDMFYFNKPKVWPSFVCLDKSSDLTKRNFFLIKKVTFESQYDFFFPTFWHMYAHILSWLCFIELDIFLIVLQ